MRHRVSDAQGTEHPATAPSLLQRAFQAAQLHEPGGGVRPGVRLDAQAWRGGALGEVLQRHRRAPRLVALEVPPVRALAVLLEPLHEHAHRRPSVLLDVPVVVDEARRRHVDEHLTECRRQRSVPPQRSGRNPRKANHLACCRCAFASVSISSLRPQQLYCSEPVPGSARTEA